MADSAEFEIEEPIRKQVGRETGERDVFRRLERLRRNADAILGPDRWRGKDDGTVLRKVVGAPRRRGR